MNTKARFAMATLALSLAAISPGSVTDRPGFVAANLELAPEHQVDVREAHRDFQSEYDRREGNETLRRESVRLDSKAVIRSLEQDHRLEIDLPNTSIRAFVEPRVFYDPAEDSTLDDVERERRRPVYVYEGVADDDSKSRISVVVTGKSFFLTALYQTKSVALEPPKQSQVHDDGNDFFLELVDLPDTDLIGEFLEDSLIAPCSGSTDIEVFVVVDDEFLDDHADPGAAAFGVINGINPLTDTGCADISVASTAVLDTDTENCDVILADVASLQATFGDGHVALLMSGADLFGVVEGTNNFGLIGCAYQSACCSPASADSAAVIEVGTSSFVNRMVGAHELGHTLSGTHEGSINWDPDRGRKDCPGPTTGVHCTIMSAQLRNSAIMSEFYSAGNSRAIAAWASKHAPL